MASNLASVGVEGNSKGETFDRFASMSSKFSLFCVPILLLKILSIVYEGIYFETDAFVSPWDFLFELDEILYDISGRHVVFICLFGSGVSGRFLEDED